MVFINNIKIFKTGNFIFAVEPEYLVCLQTTRHFPLA